MKKHSKEGEDKEPFKLNILKKKVEIKYKDLNSSLLSRHLISQKGKMSLNHKLYICIHEIVTSRILQRMRAQNSTTRYIYKYQHKYEYMHARAYLKHSQTSTVYMLFAKSPICTHVTTCF